MADTERRHEWTDPETGSTVWLDENRVEMNTHGIEVENPIGVLAHYSHSLAAKCDRLERERDAIAKLSSVQEAMIGELESNRSLRINIDAQRVALIAALKAELVVAQRATRAPASTYRKEGA